MEFYVIIMRVITMEMLTPRRLPVSDCEAVFGFSMRWQDDTSNYMEKLIFAHIVLRNQMVYLLPYSIEITFKSKPLSSKIKFTSLYHV
jgi:hypothetical protein